MSKPIKISFGKSKSSLPAAAATRQPQKGPVSLTSKPRAPALRHDSDDEDEVAPQHESITAFAADGAVLTEPVQLEDDVVIKNAGNGDWRNRGRSKGQLPAEVQAQREAEKNGTAIVVERDEVSTASGLQLAEHSQEPSNAQNEISVAHNGNLAEPVKELTEDERALQALLSDGTGDRVSNTVIEISENLRPKPQDETDDFRADVASRPDSCTLEEYAAMPVEEFGMAMLRGMGQKRRANGEIISYSNKGDQTNGSAPKVREPRQGYLGIGAKAAPGAEVELGAWGKTAMRKNQRGEGFYTPVMLRDKRTGEMLTEEELEIRKKEAKEKLGRSGKAGREEDWRERRDRNLERSGRDKDHRNGHQKLLMDTKDDEFKEQMNDFSRASSSGRDKDGYRSDRSRRDRDRERSRSRSRSRERDRRRNDEDDRKRERRRDKHRDDTRYDSSSSRKSSHRHGLEDDRRHREHR